MNAITPFTNAEALRAEAAIEPDPVSTTPVKKETQIIAIYGKGGIGKSFTLANLSYMMAQQGKKELALRVEDEIDEELNFDAAGLRRITTVADVLDLLTEIQHA